MFGTGFIFQVLSQKELSNRTLNIKPHNGAFIRTIFKLMPCHNNYLQDGIKVKAVSKRVQNINIINILLPGGMFDVR